MTEDEFPCDTCLWRDGDLMQLCEMCDDDFDQWEEQAYYSIHGQSEKEKQQTRVIRILEEA